MNDNPGETPNPLNQSQAATPTQSAPTADAPSGSTTAPVASLDPTGRNMEQNVPVVEPPKKKHTGLIVGVIIGTLVVIAGIVAAVLLVFNNKSGDGVTAAIQKILSGDASENVAIDGDINILLNDDELPIKRMHIDLDSDIVVGSMINTSSAVLTFTDRNDKDYSIEVEEIYSDNNNLYFKIDGAADALEGSGLINLMSGIGNADSDYAAELSKGIISLVEGLEGAYLRVSSEELNLIGDEGSSNQSTISCVSNLISGANKDSDSTIQLYQQYPFILSSDKDILIASKQNPIYRVSLDSENLTGFIKGIQNTEIVNSLYSCLNLEDNLNVSEDDIATIVEKMPKVYAEVNSNNDFTRLYLESDINEGMATATIDLGFSYPTNVTAAEPVEYTDFSEFLQTLFSGMYDMSGVNEAE